MVKIEVKIQSRLDGADVLPGEVVELENGLAAAWIKAGRARAAGEPGKPPDGEETDLKKLSIKKLTALAEDLGIPPPESKISKQDLIELIEEQNELPEDDAGEGEEGEGPEEIEGTPGEGNQREEASGSPEGTGSEGNSETS